MAKKLGPTFRAIWLGEKLRAMRIAKGLEQDEVAQYVGIGSSSVGRMEKGTYPPKGGEMVLLLKLYGVNNRAEHQELMEMARDAAERGWVESLVSDRTFADFIWAEGKASRIHSFQLAFFSGLLQEPSYAEALIRLGPSRDREGDVLQLLAARIGRGERLTGPDVPEVRFLVHEAVLHQRIKGIDHSVYQAQFKHLLKVAQYPNVKLRIAPLEWAQHNPQGVPSGFTILELPSPWPMLMHVETPIGGMVAEAPDIDSYSEIYEDFWADVLDEEHTIQRLETMLKELGK